jgi:hypothetical protein
MVNDVARITELLQELKSELQEARSDITFLKEEVLNKKKPKRKWAKVTMPFTVEFDEPAVKLTEEIWNKVKCGEMVQFEGKGLEIDGYDGKLFDRWTFSGGVGGRVKLEIGFDEQGKYDEEVEERLTADMIDEFVVDDEKRGE